MALVVLRGGSRDGESTTVDDEVERLLAASDAPGMVDVYEATDETAPVRGNDEPAIVFVFSAQEPIGDLAPEMLHMPPRHGG
jgi:hypothetical protein